MHEKRNFIMVLLLITAVIWGTVVWFIYDAEELAFPIFQRATSLFLLLAMIGFLIYALRFEDKLPDRMKEIVGEIYYNADGLAFMPTIRREGEHAKLCVYYQNNFENPAHAIVHLRPPEECFIIQPGMRDVHFAFTAGGGDFGMITQPITVPRHLQGEVVEIQLAAVSYYPRSHGAQLRRDRGLSCGSLLVDWGSAFRTGVHEVSGEIQLNNPAHMRLSLPAGVEHEPMERSAWRQECLAAGVAG
jgi:hypothetical protein